MDGSGSANRTSKIDWMENISEENTRSTRFLKQVGSWHEWQVRTGCSYFGSSVHSLPSGGSKGGGVRDARPPPPSASKFFQFHAVFGRIRQNCVFTPPPPWRVHAPPWGNPGSVTASIPQLVPQLAKMCLISIQNVHRYQRKIYLKYCWRLKMFDQI